ncbi:MAG: DUF4430 domain-containing protein [Eggerthella lenta]
MRTGSGRRRRRRGRGGCRRLGRFDGRRGAIGHRAFRVGGRCCTGRRLREPAAPSAPSTVTVSVYIDSSRAASYGYPSSLGGGTVTLNQGASVYDALCATGASVGGSSSYVSSIGGLAEFACGPGSGWLYFVNGSSPGYGCGSYILSGGENITWIYTCDLGNDL